MIDPDRLAELFAKSSVLRDESTELLLLCRHLRNVSRECRIFSIRELRLEALRERSEVQTEDDLSV